MEQFGKSEAEDVKKLSGKERGQHFSGKRLLLRGQGLKLEERRTMKGTFISSLGCVAPLFKRMMHRGWMARG